MSPLRFIRSLSTILCSITKPNLLPGRVPHVGAINCIAAGKDKEDANLTQDLRVCSEGFRVRGPGCFSGLDVKSVMEMSFAFSPAFAMKGCPS